MTSNLVDLIFNQFVEMVLDRAQVKGDCELGECDFSFRTREYAGHKLMDVLYKARDQCDRVRDVITTIDITSICYEDLCTCRWRDYLEKIARAYTVDVCPRRLSLVCDVPSKCREQPPQWRPFPTKTTTTIYRKRPVDIIPEEPVVVIEEECQCIPVCKREPCTRKKEVIIRYKNEPAPKCGSCLQLVPEPKEKYDFKQFKDVTDYNSNIYRGDCASCGGDVVSEKSYYEATVHH